MEQANILYDLGYYEIIVFILFIYLFHLLYQKIGFKKGFIIKIILLSILEIRKIIIYLILGMSFINLIPYILLRISYMIILCYLDYKFYYKTPLFIKYFIRFITSYLIINIIYYTILTLTHMISI